MIKPTFVTLETVSPGEIRECIKVMGMTHDSFGRLFPVTGATVSKWVQGVRNPYGPCTARLMEIKEYTDHVTEEKRKSFERLMKK